MSIELTTFLIGLAIGICIGAILVALERFNYDKFQDMNRVKILTEISKLKQEIQDIKRSTIS